MVVPGIPHKADPSDVDEPDVSGLVTEDDTPVDGIIAEKQARLLTETLYSSWSGPAVEPGQPPRPFAAMANVGLFWSVKEPPIVPDVLLSLDVDVPEDLDQKKNRSYFLWRYGKPPDVVIEIVSNREGDELGEKLQKCLQLKVPYYVVYDPLHQLGDATLQAFELRGHLYAPTNPVWLERIGLGLVQWRGKFENRSRRWLRWCDRKGTVVPTGAETSKVEKTRADSAEARVKVEKTRADSAQARAETAEARAKVEKERADKLAAKLRALGFDPNTPSYEP